eukprot:s1173_g7.t1
MKREVPATPFKVDGPNTTWTSSTDSPEKPADQLSGQPATMSAINNQPANPAQEAVSLASRAKRGQGSAAASGGSAQWGGSTASGHQIPPGLHQHNTIQQHMYQQQVNQIDPMQLEQLSESLVNAKAEANYQQLRQQAQQEVEQTRQQAGSNHQMLQEQVYQKLSQLSQEKQMLKMREREREKQTHAQAQQRLEQLQHEAENHITRLSDDNKRLQAELEDTLKAAEGQMTFVKLRAEAERQRAVAELRELSSKLGAAHRANKDAYSHPDRAASASGSVM